MKIYCSYVYWNKGGMLRWVCDGIKKSLPKGSIVDFVFDNCTDDSEKIFQTLINAPADAYGSLRGFEVRWFSSTKKLRMPNVNDAIERFMKSDAVLFLTPQDDMKLQDPYIAQNLTKLYQECANIGIVGMRDGIIPGRYYSSSHSPGGPPPTPTTYLRSGEYKLVDQVNDGPLVLSKFSVEKVGLFNCDYWAHYHEPDYGWRAQELGLSNYVMGCEIVHEKWGCKTCGEIQQSEIWSQEYSSHDYDLHKSRWANRL